jgi:hypothetical protein
MKYGTLVASVRVMRELIVQPMPLRTAYALHKITTKMDEELGFYTKKHNEIAQSELSEEEKTRQITELLNMDIEWDLAPVHLSLNDDIRLSAADIDAAKGLIEFDEDES